MKVATKTPENRKRIVGGNHTLFPAELHVDNTLNHSHQVATVEYCERLSRNSWTPVGDAVAHLERICLKILTKICENARSTVGVHHFCPSTNYHRLADALNHQRRNICDGKVAVKWQGVVLNRLIHSQGVHPRTVYRRKVITFSFKMWSLELAKVTSQRLNAKCHRTAWRKLKILRVNILASGEIEVATILAK